MAPVYMNGATGERGDYAMKYRCVCVRKEPGNESETVTENVAYAMTHSALTEALSYWNRSGSLRSKANPYLFWRYELISIDIVK